MNHSYEPWAIYEERIDSKGETRRGAALQREQKFIRRKLRHSLSYHVANVDGRDQEVAIINSDNLDIKTLISMPGEDIRNGSYVVWNGFYWIVVAKDENTEVYTKTTMKRCNYLLKWIKEDGTIVERWSIISDGTKLSQIVSAYRDVRDKRPIELLEYPKALSTTTRDETRLCECGESRKKLWDGIRLNPKCFINGRSAAKPRTAEGSTTILYGVGRKRSALEVVGV